MAGTWASRLGVHVWEPRVVRASVPDRGWRVGTSLSTAPSPQMLGADLGHVCTHVYTVDVHMEAWISVCMPMSEYAHACISVGMCMCTRVHVRTTK